MRCTESFLHLCAMGMFDDTDVHLLALDTDKENGNFKRLREIKEAYLNSKGLDRNKHTTLKNSFFSARLNYYEFSPDYSQKSNFETLFNYDDAKDLNREKADLARLLIPQNGRKFDLKRGYRALPSLGSLLMYVSILDEVKTKYKSDIRSYVEELINASSSGHPRIFILGSIFGGTGASSISIIPKALSKAASFVADASDIEKNAFLGSTLLTGYFSFKLPSEKEKKEQLIIASSDKFALNSQTAMMFYEADNTIKKTYQKFYMLGTQDMDWKPSQSTDITITGGEKQENDSHFIELMEAFAAYDFFNLPEADLEQNKFEGKLDYLYRTVNVDGKLHFNDFIGLEQKEVLAKKMGLFVAMSFLISFDKYDFMTQAFNGDLDNKQVKFNYNTIDKEEINSLKKYFNLFHCEVNGSKVKDGWLRQVHKSAGGGDKFLFNPELFKSEGLVDFAFNKKLFPLDSDFTKNSFSVNIFSSIFDSFKTAFLKTSEPASVSHSAERFIKHTYDTLVSLYKF